MAGQPSKKIFVGSLPHNIDEASLRSEFGKHGRVESVFVKQGCEVGRQWAFVTFGTPAEAQVAKDECDRKLMFPGSEKACDVTIARNQGMFGQEPTAPKPVDPLAALYGGLLAAAPGAPMLGAPLNSPVHPRKIFVGSLPDSITEQVLRDEFQKYGPITDFFLKTGCEPGRQWAFITFQSAEQANLAKASADRTLTLPGADKPCEVMIAKNQQKNGAEAAGAAALSPLASLAAMNPLLMALGQQIPGFQMPFAMPPAWQTYYTTAGMPYYHNASTGVTQWEAPPELAGAAGGMPAMPQASALTGHALAYSAPLGIVADPGLAGAAAYGQPGAYATQPAMGAYGAAPAAVAYSTDSSSYGAAAAPAAYGAAPLPALAAYGAAPQAAPAAAFGAAPLPAPTNYGVPPAGGFLPPPAAADPRVAPY